MFKHIVTAIKSLFNRRPPAAKVRRQATEPQERETWLERVRRERDEERRRKEIRRRLRSRSHSRAYPVRPRRIAACQELRWL